MPKHPPPVEYRWKPGQSGNPSGRKKGVGLTDRLRKLFQSDDVQTAFIEAAREAAIEKGDFRFWEAIMDRLEGPIPKEHHVGGLDPSRMTEEELRALAAGMPNDDDESGTGGGSPPSGGAEGTGAPAAD
jgi:hypothetical protein